MRQFRLLGVMSVAVCAMGLMATSAFALPDISVTLGGTYPLHLNFSSETITTKLEATTGSVLEGKGLHVLYLLGELTALGTFRAIILNYVAAGTTESCLNTANAGEVLTEGSFHIAYTSLASSGFGLRLGILLLLKEVTITCPVSAMTIKLKGSMLAAIRTPGTSNAEQLTGLKSLLSGSGGKQQFRAYYNEAGGALLAQLLCNASGTGFKECNLVVSGEPEATALEGKMFVISGR